MKPETFTQEPGLQPDTSGGGDATMFATVIVKQHLQLPALPQKMVNYELELYRTMVPDGPPLVAVEGESLFPQVKPELYAPVTVTISERKEAVPP